jgi:hypothetical protein
MDEYRYRLLAPHASCADVSQRLFQHARGRHCLAFRVRDDGEWLPVALFDSAQDAQAFRVSYDTTDA